MSVEELTAVRHYSGVVHKLVDVISVTNGVVPQSDIGRLIRFTDDCFTVRGLCGRRMKMHYANKTRLTDAAVTCLLCVAEEIYAAERR